MCPTRHPAPRLLTPYCESGASETSRRAIGECLRVPTVVSMANVYVNMAGFIWNKDVREKAVRAEPPKPRLATHC